MRLRLSGSRWCGRYGIELRRSGNLSSTASLRRFWLSDRSLMLLILIIIVFILRIGPRCRDFICCSCTMQLSVWGSGSQESIHLPFDGLPSLAQVSSILLIQVFVVVDALYALLLGILSANFVDSETWSPLLLGILHAVFIEDYVIWARNCELVLLKLLVYRHLFHRWRLVALEIF